MWHALLTDQVMCHSMTCRGGGATQQGGAGQDGPACSAVAVRRQERHPGSHRLHQRLCTHAPPKKHPSQLERT